eukprot:8333-Heterococcus_DN1.PRE.4
MLFILTLLLCRHVEYDLSHTHAYIHKQAYQIACVAVDICAVIPAVAQYTLGLMQRGCPYLIPVIVFDSAALDDDAYKAALGMRPDDTVSTCTLPLFYYLYTGIRVTAAESCCVQQQALLHHTTSAVCRLS